MIYLHKSPIGYHSRLKSSNILINNKWSVRISDFGLSHLRYYNDRICNNKDKMFKDMLYKAPEALRKSSSNYSITQLQLQDVYSYGIIIQECLTQNKPWGHINYDPNNIFERIIIEENPPYRPYIENNPDDIYDVGSIMKMCWNENPLKRPQFHVISRMINTSLLQTGTRNENYVENLMDTLQAYSNNLEEIVQHKIKQFQMEYQRKKELLNSMIPSFVVDLIIQKKQIKPEYYENITLLFTDISNFSQICLQLSPIEIVQYLDNLYTLFDEIIDHYNVYKVETIADQYVVVAGIPNRNKPENNAEEMASLALHLMRATKKLKFCSSKSYHVKTQLRIGIHSGPVVAGIIGISMPRYCLFGDTMNTASRVLTTGLVLKINITEQTKLLLDQNNLFIIGSKQKVFMKGKGYITTYILDNSKRNLIGQSSGSTLRIDHKQNISTQSLNN